MASVVLIVDDHPFVHDVLREVVRAVLPGAAVHAERSFSAALDRARSLERLDLVLLDLGLPGYTGIDALVRFREANSNTPVAIVSTTDDGATVRAALDAGAVGYLPKTSTPKVMVAALRVIAAGGTYVPLEALADVSPDRGLVRISEARTVPGGICLTDRQVEVLRLLAKGTNYRQIARQLGITESTVKQHAHAAYQILGVSNRTEAITAAARMRIRLD